VLGALYELTSLSGRGNYEENSGNYDKRSDGRQRNKL